MIFEKPLTVDYNELCRALGYIKAQPDYAVQAVIRDALELLYSAVKPKWLYKRCVLNGNFMLAEYDIPLQGESVKTWLQGCKACFIFCVTLGHEVDSLLRTTQAQDMQLAYIVDTAASILAEDYTQAADDELVALANRSGEHTNMRVSPGYGDLPLVTNSDVITKFNTAKLIGLTAQPAGTLVPQKSVVALKGILNAPATEEINRCTYCAMLNNCEYRKKGEYSLCAAYPRRRRG